MPGRGMATDRCLCAIVGTVLGSRNGISRSPPFVRPFASFHNPPLPSHKFSDCSGEGGMYILWLLSPSALYKGTLRGSAKLRLPQVYSSVNLILHS